MPRGKAAVKTIIVSRNPKDTAVSMWHHVREKVRVSREARRATRGFARLEGSAESLEGSTESLEGSVESL